MPDRKEAAQFIIAQLYDGIPLPDSPLSDKTPKLQTRNAEIGQRYGNGESVAHLAFEFGISEQRVWQIVQQHETE